MAKRKIPGNYIVRKMAFSEIAKDYISITTSKDSEIVNLLKISAGKAKQIRNIVDLLSKAIGHTIQPEYDKIDSLAISIENGMDEIINAIASRKQRLENHLETTTEPILEKNIRQMLNSMQTLQPIQKNTDQASSIESETANNIFEFTQRELTIVDNVENCILNSYQYINSIKQKFLAENRYKTATIDRMRSSLRQLKDITNNCPPTLEKTFYELPMLCSEIAANLEKAAELIETYINQANSYFKKHNTLSSIIWLQIFQRK